MCIPSSGSERGNGVNGLGKTLPCGRPEGVVLWTTSVPLWMSGRT